MATIMVVDDRAINRQFLVALLGYGNHRLLEASDGLAGLELARQEHPDLIITDILMPTMDGVEFIRRLRKEPTIAKTPVIFYTATYRVQEARALAQTCGVFLVLAKPSEPEVILKTVNEALGLTGHFAVGKGPPLNISAFGDKLSSYIAKFQESHLGMGQAMDDALKLISDTESSRQTASKLSESLNHLREVSLRISALVELNLSIMQETDPVQLLRQGCRGAQDIISARYVAVAILADDGLTVGHFVTTGLDADSLARLGVPSLQEEILIKLLKKNQPYRVHDLKGNPQSVGLPSTHPSIDSFLVVPIASGKQSFGWLYLANRVGHDRFSEVDEQIAVTLGAQVGVSYERVRLYDEVQRRSAQLELEVIERKRSEEGLKLFRSLLDQSNDLIFVVKPLTACFLDVNNTACISLGYTRAELLGMGVMNIKAETPDNFFWNTHVQETKAKSFVVLESKLKRKDGSVFTGQVNVKYIVHEKVDYMVVVIRDITEQKKLEAQFLRAQRMESIGTLAGGIAHDLNNIFAPVIMALPMFKKKLSDEPSRQLLDSIGTSVQRGADIVRQILSFARGTGDDRVEVQLRHMVQEVEKIIQQTFPKSIELSRHLPENLGCVLANPTQMQQVLMNLCVNARDAMPKGGKLNISLENLSLDEGQARNHPGAKAGPYVLIAISDTGSGIPPELMDKIFDPFFTTKKIGKGTGLGLLSVTNIVKDHGGFLSVESKVGAGSCFRFHLPATRGTSPKDEKKDAPIIPRGAGEWVLVVDDEATICQIMHETLEGYGYRVVSATDGADALVRYTQNLEKIAAIIIDMEMPILNGAATIHALRRITPNIKIIASSGSKENVPDNLSIQAFLRKPFTVEILLKTLHEILALNE